ncbi:MAG: glycosyl hydrolase, partial [Gemmatimonadetes bacterium]|nr:glycosyl hydrolase [Gemmatimonadota bacterium]
PILISPHDPARLYFASQRVYRSDNRGDAWTPISGDLSRGLDRYHLPMMGRIWSFDAVWDLYAMSEYGTVTSLSESPLVEGLLYAGTDDGLIQVSEDGGASWRKTARLPGVKDFYFVNDIKADLHDANTAYVCVDHHKNGDFTPYVFKTTDRGRKWKSIAGDLPDRHIVWRLVQDHEDPELLFLGTEFGVFFSGHGGDRWVELDSGVPNIAFRDLAIQRRENDLVGATFGRGFYVLDDYSPLRHLDEAALEREALLFPVRDAWWYIERPLRGSGKGTQGAGFFTAPNPPFGAVFTYYLRDAAETRKEARRKAERETAESGGDNPRPDWDALLLEEREEEPSVVLTVKDEQGKVVRRIEGAVAAGVHRVAWDLRYPSPQPHDPSGSDPAESRWSRGLMAPPGTYTVSLGRRVDGRLEDLGQTETFTVRPLREGTLAGASPEEKDEFRSAVDAVRRDLGAAKSALTETAARLDGIRTALLRSTGNDALHEEVREMDRRLDDLALLVNGHYIRQRMNHAGPVSIDRRVDVLVYASLFSNYGPNDASREVLRIARRDLD